MTAGQKKKPKIPPGKKGDRSEVGGVVNPHQKRNLFMRRTRTTVARLEKAIRRREFRKEIDLEGARRVGPSHVI